MQSIKEEEAFEAPKPAKFLHDDRDPIWKVSPSSATGVLFSKSVRSSFCMFHVALMGPNSEHAEKADPRSSEDLDFDVVLVRLQFPPTDNLSFRSHCRRFFKIGDLITIQNGIWRSNATTSTDDSVKNVIELPMLKRDRIEGFSGDEHTTTPESIHEGKSAISSPSASASPRPTCSLQKNDRAAFEKSAPVDGEDEALRDGSPSSYACASSRDQTLRKLILEPKHLQDIDSYVRVLRLRFWKMTICQKLQQQYGPRRLHPILSKCQPSFWGYQDSDTYRIPPVWMDHPTGSEDATAADTHGKGLEKRVQAEYVARFLVHMIMYKLLQSQQNANGDSPCVWSSSFLEDSSTWATHDPRTTNPLLFKQAVDWLNAGTGVIDAAGGSGHVSMQLGMLGVRSTVIDAREAVGKLPGRDRKIWKQALKASKNKTEDLYCQPVIEYAARRGWIGPPVEGVDESFRHPGENRLDVYDAHNDFFLNCTAVVALHPDEATEAIVDLAVAEQKPVAVVPCCVFARLFPQRMAPGSNQLVSSRLQLIRYLKDKHESIRQAQLSFPGANVLLWSVF